MEYVSPFNLVKQLESQLMGVLLPIDINAVSADEQKLITKIRYDIVDARLDARDYELSETRDEQKLKAKAATERLRALGTGILTASEQNVFGAADVAQLSAQIEQIIANLK